LSGKRIRRRKPLEREGKRLFLNRNIGKTLDFRRESVILTACCASLKMPDGSDVVGTYGPAYLAPIQAEPNAVKK
jgi:hypothetical protein